MIGIYKITNNINGKCYVGQSDNIERRWREHKKRAFKIDNNQQTNLLYRAMQKYGIDNFKFEILEECTKDCLDEREIYYIAKYQSYINGYNLTTGGSRCATTKKLSHGDIAAIKKRLKTTTDNMFVIANDFNVHWTTIRTINTGQSHYDPHEQYPIREQIYTNRNGITKFCSELKEEHRCTKCGAKTTEKGVLCVTCSKANQRVVRERPNPMILAKQITEIGFEQVGKYYGVSGKAISKWCKSYGIPHTIKELKQWYITQVRK